MPILRSRRSRLATASPLLAAVLLAAAACGIHTVRAHGAAGPLRDGRDRRPMERPPGDHNTEAYDRIYDNPFLAARDNPLSTFSIDVDTASYANVRRFLREEHLPPPDAVRIEELVNYFRYAYPAPEGDGAAGGHDRGRPVRLEPRAPPGPDRPARADGRAADRPRRAT